MTSAQLRRLPRLPQPPLDLLAELIDPNPDLGQAVAITQGHGAVLERLMIDRHRPRSPDLVLAAIAAADRATLVVLGLDPVAQLQVQLARQLGLAILADQR